MNKKRVLSGIKPSGVPTLGNYIGAISNWVALQKEYATCLFPIVDLHAITVPQEPTELTDQTYIMTAFLLACGIDPKKSILFLQSHIPAHTELGWILTTQTNMGELSRMTQFKDKALDHRDSVGVGLFTYPALMAADILLYQTDVVPVGEDQKQHVELTRDIAERFNRRFGPTFVIPQPVIAKEGARIMSLDDPTQKMNKSSDRDKSYILITDDADSIRRKIMSATTDSGANIEFDQTRPGLHNLLTIYKVLSGKTEKQIETKFAGQGYGTFKADLAELVVDTLTPIQTKMNKYLEDRSSLDKVLAAGAKKALKLAQPTLADVRQKLGLVG